LGILVCRYPELGGRIEFMKKHGNLQQKMEEKRVMSPITEQEVLRKILVDLFLASPRKAQQAVPSEKEGTSENSSVLNAEES
jgi:hypothetical protein